MLYIKITDVQDGTVLAAEALSEPVFVMWQEKNKIPIRCSEHKAQGIVSEDGSIIYQLAGKAAMPTAESGMEAATIDEWEYEEIIERLDPPEPEPQPDPEPEPEPDVPMTPAQMRLKIKEQGESIDMLTECILEMSEAVYGG